MVADLAGRSEGEAQAGELDLAAIAGLRQCPVTPTSECSQANSLDSSPTWPPLHLLLRHRMSRQKTIKLPALDLTKTASVPSPLRSRPRSASIVKVEEVGDRSVDEVLDRSAYANINADWVNAKGVS
jgi:hypothetical protein